VANGRSYLTPGDVQRVAVPVLGHRLLLHPGTEVVGAGPESIVDDLLQLVPVVGAEDPRDTGAGT
jgi:MoxR-like ATPase